MKRKALVFLSVAILAVAMIPAIGVQAAAGEVKLVTPGELAYPNPSSTNQREFVALAVPDFVSTQLGKTPGTDSGMEDTFGTLYVVVSDNDNDANQYKSSITIAYPVTAGSKGITNFGLTITGKIVVDRNRNGELDEEDVTVYGGDNADFTPAANNRIFATNVRSITTNDTANDPAKWTSLITLDETGLPEDTSHVKVEYSTSDRDSLASATGTRVTVRSSSGDSIGVVARESKLSEIANLGGSGTGTTPADLAAEDSANNDSGEFVGAFGLIRNDWKDMLDDWVTRTPNNPNATSADIAIRAVTVLTDATKNTTIVEFPDLTGTQAIADDNGDGVIDALDFDVTYVDATGGITVDSVTLEGTSSLKVTLKVGTEAVDTVNDSFTLKYATTGTISDLEEDIDDTNASGHTGSFEDLDDADDKKQAVAFTKALSDHESNLGAIGGSVGDSATLLINRLLGVTHGDEVTVRYNDASGGVQRVSTTVDTVAPSITAVNPVNDSFTTDDRIDGLFNVTDSDAGIPRDAEATTVRKGENYVDVGVEIYEVGETPGDTFGIGDRSRFIEGRENVADGYQYEYRVDIPTATVLDAEDNNNNLVVEIRVTAFDQAGNRATKTIKVTSDTIDPELLGALTGWGVAYDADADRAKADDEKGAYVLKQNQRTWIALVFNGEVDGAAVNANDVFISGESVEDVVWLNNSGANVLNAAGDFKGPNANDDITSQQGGGLAIAKELNQDARHVLFVKLADNLPTDARPGVEINANDLADLAGNKNNRDHEINAARDRLNPVFTVTVANALSRSGIDLEISSSEELDGRPSAMLSKANGDDSETVVALSVDDTTSETQWTVSDTLSGLDLSSNGTDDGVWTVTVNGTDEHDNDGSNAAAKWELDTRANRGDDPDRKGVTVAANTAQKIEVDDVTFLTLDFTAEKGEDGEYPGDTKAKIAIDSLTLETLSASSLTSKGVVKTGSGVTVEATDELPATTAQSSNGIRHIIALSDLALGNYRLKVEFADEAGNTGKFNYVFKITAPAPARVDVTPGWSLVSIPGRPQDRSIGNVLSGSAVTEVWSLSNASKVWEFSRLTDAGAWEGTLVQITDGRAYFVRSTTFDPITVLLQRFSPQRTPPSYAVTAGWNGIGYTPSGGEGTVAADAYLSSLGGGGWGMIRTWDTGSTPPKYVTYFSNGTYTAGFELDGDIPVVKKGVGYLLFATRDGTIGG